MARGTTEVPGAIEVHPAAGSPATRVDVTVSRSGGSHDGGGSR